jgi:glycosyltransferase involved in cell wall biosynthesis
MPKPRKHFQDFKFSSGDAILSSARKIEYPGNLKVFKAFGTHPQFRHLKHPPEGYSFISSEELNSNSPFSFLSRAISTFISAKRLAKKMRIEGVPKKDIKRFIKTRRFKSQCRINGKADIIFFPSVPLHYDQAPWVIEMEDSIMPFYPFLGNGYTYGLKDLREKSFYKIFKLLYESPNCKAIITHVKSTAETLPIMFGNPELASKITYIPIGIQAPDHTLIEEQKKKSKNKNLNFIFTNSWHQDPLNFYARGGIDTLCFFQKFNELYPESKLTIRSRIPENLPEEYRKILENKNISVLDAFMPMQEWEELRMQADFYLLPSARLHVVSILEAMAFGSILVTSNGWGIEDYAQNGHNAIVLPGRDKVTKMDDATGILKEDYRFMFHSDAELVDKMVEAVVKLVENPEEKERIVEQARKDIETKFTLENWNQELKKVFDKIFASS